jgi:hypothetical protein
MHGRVAIADLQKEVEDLSLDFMICESPIIEDGPELSIDGRWTDWAESMDRMESNTFFACLLKGQLT